MTTQEKLAQRDFILMIDQSGSMGDPCSAKDPRTRWEAAQEMTLALARKCSTFDADGITVIPFNNAFKVYKNIKGAVEEVKKIFTENGPNSGTDTALALKHVLDDYFVTRSKPITVLVVTDGTPNDKNKLREVIVEAANKMNDDNEIGISFLQIGDDPHARKFLKELDDDLQKTHKAKFDIVDTKDDSEMSTMNIEDVLEEAVNG